jgi:aquaporin related protein
MMVCGALPPMRGLFLIPAQLIAGIVAAALVSCMLPGPLAVVTTLTAGTSIAQGVFIEMFLTALLVFVILMLAAEKSSVTPVAPIGIGLALFVAELAGVYFTGGSLNPARSFGPSVVARSFPGYHWIYWLGPVMGGVLAGGYYKWLRYMNYEQVNPGQDATSEQEKIQVTSRTQSQMDMEV